MAAAVIKEEPPLINPMNHLSNLGGPQHLNFNSNINAITPPVSVSSTGSFDLSNLLSDRDRCRVSPVMSGTNSPMPASLKSPNKHQKKPINGGDFPSTVASPTVSSNSRLPINNTAVVTSTMPATTPHTETNNKKAHSNAKTPNNDPLSHRIIEKRRRDRMNNCLADLSRLIPTYYLKKGRGRIEKTEIIEMAIKYIKHLQAHACNNIESCEVTAKQERAGKELEQFNLGYQECISEVMHFLMESEGLYTGDSLSMRLVNHLTKHCDKILASEGYISRQSGASSSSSSGYYANGSSNGSSSDNGNGSNHATDSKEALLTEESAYRSDERQNSDDLEDISNNLSSSNPNTPHITNGTSAQLRNMLTNSGNMIRDRLQPFSYISGSGPSSSNSSSGDDNSGRMYKFKSNMKHRFNVDLEHSHKSKKSRRDSGSSCGNYTDCEKDCNISSSNHHNQRPASRPNNFPTQHEISKGEDDWDSSPVLEKQEAITPPLPSSGHNRNANDPSRHVPIFALNQNGTYVPLIIDQSIVAPAMENLQEVSTVPHPISIYVNFCSPYQVPLPGSMATPLKPAVNPAHLPFSHHPVPTVHTESQYGRSHHREDRRRYSQHHDHHHRTQYPYTLPHPPEHQDKKEFNENDIRDTAISHPHSRAVSDMRQTPRDVLSHHSHPETRIINDQRDGGEVRDSRGGLRTVRDTLRENGNAPIRDYLDGNFMMSGYPRANIPWQYHIPSTKLYKE